MIRDRECTEGGAYLAGAALSLTSGVFPLKPLPMRTVLAMTTFAAVLAVSAQQWCPPGAVWTYRYQDWGGGSSVDYRAEYRYTGDTMYNGVLAHRVETTLAGTAYGQPISGAGTEYTANEDGVIWIWSTPWDGGTPGWDTLYWFGAQVGDRWWPPGHPQDCPPHGMLEVVSIGEYTLQGSTLTKWELGEVDAEGNVFPGITLIERIGMTPRIPHFFMCDGVIEYFFPALICYSDEEIQLPEGEECHLTLSMNGPDRPISMISIHPNPGTTGFEFTGIGDRPATLRLYDMQGRMVLDGITAMDRRPVGTGLLHAGTYLVEVTMADGRRQVLRWTKE